MRNKYNTKKFDSKTSKLQPVNQSELSRLDTADVHQRVADSGAYFGEIQGEGSLSGGAILISPNTVRLYEGFLNLEIQYFMLLLKYFI